MSSSKRLDNRLFVAVSLLLTVVIAVLFLNLLFQQRAYNDALGSLDRSSETFPAAALSLARAMDFAFTKTCAILLGFAVVLIGALHLLRSVAASLELEGTGPAGTSLTLQTSSPGLVLVTLGLATVVLALYAKSVISLDYTGMGDQAAGSPIGTAAVPRASSTHERRSGPMEADVLIGFGPGSNELSETAKHQLVNLAAILKREPGATVSASAVVGAEDSANNEIELVLSQRRLQVVQDFLERLLQGPSRVRAVSQGEERPAGAAGSGVRLVVQRAPG